MMRRKNVPTLLVAATLSTCGLPAEEPTAESPAAGVTFEQIVSASERPGDWLTYSGQYNGQRYSRLCQINDANAHNLRVKWVRQFPTLSLVETTPLVVDGVMYLTIPPNEVKALDARTGLEYWHYIYPVPDRLCLCCGKVNRGVAILGETLYLGTLDAHLVAIDCRSGRLRWMTKVAESTTGHSITAGASHREGHGNNRHCRRRVRYPRIPSRL